MKKTITLFFMCFLAGFTAWGQVCQIDNTGVKYATLTDALNAVTSNQTITLLADITHTTPIDLGNKSVTFNLGLYHLTVDVSAVPGSAAITTSGNLTINGNFDFTGADIGIHLNGSPTGAQTLNFSQGSSANIQTAGTGANTAGILSDVYSTYITGNSGIRVHSSGTSGDGIRLTAPSANFNVQGTGSLGITFFIYGSGTGHGLNLATVGEHTVNVYIGGPNSYGVMCCFYGGDNGNGVNYSGTTGTLSVSNTYYGELDVYGGSISGNGIYTRTNLTAKGNSYGTLSIAGRGTGSGIKIDNTSKTLDVSGGYLSSSASGGDIAAAGLWLGGSTTINTGSGNFSPKGGTGVYIDTDGAVLTINTNSQYVGTKKFNPQSQNTPYSYGIYAAGALTLAQGGSYHVDVSAQGAGDKEGIFIGGGKDLTLWGDISVTTNGGDNAKGIALSGTGKVNFAGDNQKLTVGNNSAGDLTLPCHKSSVLFWTSIYDGTISSGSDADADVTFTLPAAGKYKTGSIYLSNGIPSILPATLPSGVVGVAYPATTVVATNNTESWTVSGALPDGLTINKGVISGTPTAAGTFNFTLTAGNTHGSSAPVSFSITIQNFVPVTGITGVPYSIKRGETAYLSSCYASPYDATYTNIIWSLVSAGTTGAELIDNYMITTVSKGTLVIRATIKDGKAPGTDYIQDFTIPITGFLCEIVGGNQYDDIQSAIYAVPQDNTHTVIRLLDNIFTDRMPGLNYQNITFNLNGYNLTVIGAEGGGLSVYNSRVDYTGVGAFKVITEASGYTAVNLGDNSSCIITAVEVNDPGRSGIINYGGTSAFTGNVFVNAEGAIGVQASSDDLTINGNIIVTNGTAIYAGGGAKVTVNGTVDPSLIIFNGTPCDPVSNKSAVSSKPGFTEYTDGDSYVWVSMHGTTITWQGGTSADWNTPSNWDIGRVPTSTDVVYIPGPDKVTNFPVLITPLIGPPIVMNSSAAAPGPPIDGGTPTPSVGAEVSEIHFAPGAELGRQDLLKYNKAFVQLDFSAPASRNRWWMLTNPLQQLFAADFAFGGSPGVAVQSFVSSNGLNAWKAFSDGFAHQFDQGDNFEIWLGTTNKPNQGLSVSSGIITLPYFEDPDQADVHWTHVYNPDNKTSAYSNIGVSVVRDPVAAYKLADGIFTKDLDFGRGTDQYYYAATGNPFMSSISFSKLQSFNSSLINSRGYWVWVGPATSSKPVPGGYANYNAAIDRTVGNISFGTLSDIIPPMQSFIVEKNDGTTVLPQITFNIAYISATGSNKGAGLREAAQSNDLLEITASAQQSAVRAVIASREQGSMTFNRLDSRKLSAEINDLPDIYTLKQSANKNMVAIAANVINEINEDVIIPLGISTTYEGSITLSFAGIDTYNARIFLIDNAAPDNKEIELTGKANYEYTFNYVPEKVNGTAISNEKRFAVRLSPTSITGIESAATSNILVFSRSEGTIQAVSGEAIKQITVIDMQGRKIYDNPSVSANEYTVTGLAAGVYVVKAVTGNEVKTTKIIVK